VLPVLVSALTISLLHPQPAPQTETPFGWTEIQDDRNTQFFFPHADDRNTFVAIFPTQDANGSLERALSTTWHRTIGNERIVDAQQKTTASADGAPALLEIVATVDDANRAIYRIFIAKQYGTRIVSGEFRSDDPDKMKSIGNEALRMLENIRVTQ
jgi:hypothetical protein